MDFCAGTLATANTCLALNRISISVEKDADCYYEALGRTCKYIDVLTTQEGMNIGKVRKREALERIAILEHKVAKSSESPWGTNNFPR